MKADSFTWIASEIIPGGPKRGLVTWQAYDETSRVDLTSSALLLGDTWLLVDPIPLAPVAFDRLVDEMGAARCGGVVLTSANHGRSAGWFAERLSAPVHAHPDVAGEGDLAIDVKLTPGKPFFETLEVIPLPGAAQGEIALYWPGLGGLWIIGDALIHLDATGLVFLPERYCSDRALLRRSARALLERPCKTVAFAHGRALTNDAFHRLATLIEEA